MKNYTTIILFLIFSEISFGQKKELLYDNWPTTLPTNDRSRKDLLENPELKYVPIGTTWDHRIITFFFQNGTADIAGNGERDAVRLAFTYWENATNLRFLEVCDATSADIVFRWETGAHGDPNPFGQFPPPGDFDGVNGTLAHTLGGPPPNIFGTLAGDIHFDDDETWINAVRGDGSQPIDLVTVAAHEIGHAIGLDHTTVSGALMLENYTSSHRFLGTDDILGIQSLYGASSNDFITGPSIICTSGNMSITDLPSYAGATVSWSSSNIGVLTINSSSGVATRVGLNSGSVVITATITTACGSTSITKNVHVGIPTNVYGLLDGQPVSYPQYCNTASRLAVFGSGIQTYNWAVTDGSIALTPLIDHPHMADIGFFSDYVRIRARVSNTCGNSDFIYYLLDPTMWFMAYPNPATNELTIQFSDISDAELLPKAVYLYHESSTIPKKQANVKEVYDKNGLLEGNKLIWDVSSLPRGTYYLHVVPSEKSDKKGIEKLRIILE